MAYNSHTSTLFHYTKSIKSLMSIIKEGFRYSYSKEAIGEGKYIGIPMISFCDIPISRSVEHMSKYGRYAIGIDKDFLIEQTASNIAPVTYYLNDEQMNAALALKTVCSEYDSKIKEEFNKISSGSKQITVKIDGLEGEWSGPLFEDKNISAGTKAFMMNIQKDNYNKYANSIIGYMKPYYMFRNGHKQINYDECEWRSVLPDKSHYRAISYNWIWENYDEWRTSVKNKFVEGPPLLCLTEKSVRYIIVPKEKDCEKLIEKINNLHVFSGKKIDDRIKSSLCSKIISFEHMNKDF